MSARIFRMSDFTICREPSPGYGPAVPRFGEVAPQLVEQGYLPVPLFYGEKNPCVAEEWQHYRFQPKHVAGAFSFKNSGTGILCGEVVALDIDVRNAALAAEIEALAEKELGKAPRRIGAAPKVLRIYRTDSPFPHINGKQFVLTGDDYTAPGYKMHKVEVLGLGRQFVAYNIHPDTGKPYAWNGAGDPLSVPAGELVTVTETKMRKFIDKVNALLVKHAVNTKSDDDHQNGEAKADTALKAKDPAECRSALTMIPNDDADYDYYVKIGHAIAGALGADGEKDWLDWAARSGKYDDKKSTADWKGFMRLGKAGKLRSGAGTIIHEAKEHGWQKPGREVRDFSIQLKTGDRARVLDELAGALPKIAEKRDLMVYGGLLVHPYVAQRPGFRGRMVEVLELNTLTSSALASYVDAEVSFTGWRNARGVMRPVAEDCPPWLVNTYLDRADLIANLPQQATGLAMTPVWRDGKLITARGFDLQSRKWVLSPEGVMLPGRLSRKVALDALEVLRGLLAEFRFIDERNEACALALLLTAAMRASLMFAPLFVVTKHEHGEGGSTLCTLASLIQTGRHPAVITVDAESSGAAEIEKRIDAAQLAGATNIVLDNYKTGAALNSTSLATIVTEAERDVRYLGLSKNVRCPNSQLVMVNGRNITIAEDFVRRAMRIELDTKMAAPDERKFKRPNLLNEVARDRAAILSACFTIVASYEQHVTKHGPVKITNRAGFEEWVHKVAAPLAWLLRKDVSLIPAAQRSVDPERMWIARLLPAWRELCIVMGALTKGLTVPQILTPSPTLPCSGIVVDVLVEATNAKVIANTAQLQTKPVSAFLRRIAGRVVDGQRLASVGTTGGVARWAVQEVKEDG